MLLCRDLSEATQTRLGDVKEHWRYRSKIPVNPRATALSNLDPFADLDTVFPVKKNAPADPYELDVNFEEINPKLLQPQDWHECFSIHMQYPEHITLLEGRGVIASLRHKLRSTSEFGHKHLHFCDNMSMTLLLSKGRSGTYSMLRVCRRIACLLLAADCFLAVRWIPSERNIADGPSRRWEHLRTGDVESRSVQEAKKQKILSACYPSHPEGSFDAKIDASGMRSKRSSEEESSCDDPHLHGGKESSTLSEDRPEIRGPEVQGPDSLGNPGGVSPSGCGLHSPSTRVEKFRKEESLEPESQEQLRLGLLQICEQHVRARVRLPRRQQDNGCHHRCVPRLRPEAHVVAHTKSSAGLAQNRTPVDPTSDSMATAGRHLHGANLCQQAIERVCHTTHVHGIPQPGRALRSAEVRPHIADAAIPFLLDPPASSGQATDIESGLIRRITDVGLSSSSMVGSSPSKN